MKVTARTSSEKDLIRLALEGEVISTDASGLVFISTTTLARGTLRTQTLHLEGSWRLDSSNQLRFKTKWTGRTLSLEGSWKLGPNQELIYETEGAFGRAPFLKFQSLTFKGRWEIRDRLELRYWITGTNDYLEFDGKIVRLEGDRWGTIHFELGARYRRKFSSPKQSQLAIYGRWRPISRTQIGFEVEARDTKPYLIKLTGAFELTQRNTIEFQLARNSQSQRPQLALELTHALPGKAGELFVKGETDFGKDYFLGAGARIKW